MKAVRKHPRLAIMPAVVAAISCAPIPGLPDIDAGLGDAASIDASAEDADVHADAPALSDVGRFDGNADVQVDASEGLDVRRFDAEAFDAGADAGPVCTQRAADDGTSAAQGLALSSLECFWRENPIQWADAVGFCMRLGVGFRLATFGELNAISARRAICRTLPDGGASVPPHDWLGSVFPVLTWSSTCAGDGLAWVTGSGFAGSMYTNATAAVLCVR